MSGLSCGSKSIKYILLFINLIFFIVGCAILAVGIYVIVDPRFSVFKNIGNANIAQISTSSWLDLSYLSKAGIALCVTGGIIFAISFMGCCGAWKGVRCLLGMYATFLLIILLIEIAIGVLIAVFASKLTSLITPILLGTIQYGYMGDMTNKTVFSVAWDTIMYNVQCCGVYNASDFNATINVWTTRNTSIPRSCCMFSPYTADWSGVVPTTYLDSTCPYNPTTANSYYQTGCWDKILSILSTYNYIVIGVAIGFGVFLLLGVIFTCHLCKKVGKVSD